MDHEVASSRNGSHSHGHSCGGGSSVPQETVDQLEKRVESLEIENKVLIDLLSWYFPKLELEKKIAHHKDKKTIEKLMSNGFKFAEGDTFIEKAKNVSDKFRDELEGVV